MSDKRSNEQLDGLRERLYSRGENPRPFTRAGLRENRPGKMDMAPKPRPVVPPPPVPPTLYEGETDDVAPSRFRSLRDFRKIMIIVAVSFFMLSVLASSIYIMLGRNTVSGSNIAIGITGPFTVGGGEDINLQVGITNQNSAAIESATIVVTYPPGTRSADESNKELFTERIPLESGIAPGETRNVPLKARVFGEENQESTIDVRIEYRVAGSGATFDKTAAPHRFKIGSAPVTIEVDAEEKISSGQETTIRLTLTSNSRSPLQDLIIKAEYPGGFEFTGASPAPVSGRNVWSIPNLEPEKSATIEITGIVTGTQSEEYYVRFTAGVSDGRDDEIASVLAVGDTKFVLENPFLAVDVKIDNQSGETVTTTPGDPVVVSLSVRNTLDTAVYDGLIEVKLSGNAFSDGAVTANNGYYDSNSNTVRFDASDVSALRRLNPGASANMSFTVRPEGSGLQSPQVALSVSASAKRVSESSAREKIAGTISRTIKVESRPTVVVEVVDADGPVPPRVGDTTTYEVRWRVVNSANAISGAVVTASLPTYVEWADDTSGAGAWSYNPATRSVEWRAGSVSAGGTVTGNFKVDFLPSSSLVGRTPTLVEAASLRSQDNFTGTTLRHSTGAVTTELPGDRDSGQVEN